MADEPTKGTYTLKEGAQHQVLVADEAAKRGTRRKLLGGGETVELTEAGAHAIRDKLVEFQETAPKPKPKKKAPSRKKGGKKKPS